MLTLIYPLDVTFALLSQPIITLAVEFAANLNVSLADELSSTIIVPVFASTWLILPVGVNIYLPALAANVNLGASLNVKCVELETLSISTTSKVVVFPVSTILSPAANAGDYY